MKVKDIIRIVDGEVVCGYERMNDEITSGFASDLMSDVLTLQTDNLVLLTGLANVQTIRTTEMADIGYIILVRNKKASPDLLKLAHENNQVIIQSPYSMFKTCGLLYNAGLKPVY